jgi:hypothetical protein
MSAEMTTIVVTVITAIVGPIVVYYFTKHKFEDKKMGAEDVAYVGVRITSPHSDDKVDEFFIVSGRYKNKPSKARLQLFVKPEGGMGFYPQGIATYDSNPDKTWRAECHVGGVSGASTILVAALVGPDGQILFDYYKKVGDRLGKWPSIDNLTSDIEELDRVSVTRK